MSNAKMKHVTWLFIALTIVILCYLNFYLILEVQKEYENVLRVRMDDSPITKKQVETIIFEREMSGKNSPTYTAWMQKCNVEIKNDDLSRVYKGTVLYYCGDYRGDFNLVLDDGCALSQDAVYALWGTDQILGEKVKIRDRDYTVEKVLFDENVSIVRARNDSELLFNVLDVDISKIGTQFFELEQFTFANQLISNFSFNCNYVISIMQKLSKMSFWIVSLIIACYLGKRTYHASKRGIRKGAAVTVVLGTLAAAYFILGMPFSFNQSLIPTKWSDFTFWEGVFSEVLPNISNIVLKEFYAPDALLRWTMVKLFFIFVFQSALFICLLRQVISFLERSKQAAGGGIMSKWKEGVSHGFHHVKQHCKAVWERRNSC